MPTPYATGRISGRLLAPKNGFITSPRTGAKQVKPSSATATAFKQAIPRGAPVPMPPTAVLPRKIGSVLSPGSAGMTGPQGPKGDKGDPGDAGGSPTWDNVQNKPTAFPPDVVDAVRIRNSDTNTVLYMR